MRYVPAEQFSTDDLRLSDVLAALSYALDLTSGQPPGHASRSALIGMRIAAELHFSAEDKSSLFYGLLLKDLGCSTNASKMTHLFGGDDRALKMASKSVDTDTLAGKASFIIRNVARGGSMIEKVQTYLRVALTADKEQTAITNLRCERGAEIARDLQLPEDTALAIRGLDEHWNGRGHPDGLIGDQIPLLARVMGLAQTVEVFAISQGVDAAYEMARSRRGSWFDPNLVDAMNAFRSDESFWDTFFGESPEKTVQTYEPEDRAIGADDATLDRVAEGFARVIDAKSPWTYRHSTGVSTIATGLAEMLGMAPAEVRAVRRAGLLHDVGKLGVSNTILDKPGKLDADEIAAMRKHTQHTQTILQRVAGFRPLAQMAASHHERLDGKGYHVGRGAGELTCAARLLGVADMYEALTAKRPYRKDLTGEEVMDIMAKNVAGGGICPVGFDALKNYANSGGYVPVPVAA